MEIMNIRKKRNDNYEITNPYDENEKVTIESRYAKMLCDGVYNSLSMEMSATILGTFEILRKHSCCHKYKIPVSFQNSEGVDMVIKIINHHGIEIIGDIETYHDIEGYYDNIP